MSRLSKSTTVTMQMLQGLETNCGDIVAVKDQTIAYTESSRSTAAVSEEKGGGRPAIGAWLAVAAAGGKYIEWKPNIGRSTTRADNNIITWERIHPEPNARGLIAKLMEGRENSQAETGCCCCICEYGREEPLAHISLAAEGGESRGQFRWRQRQAF